MNIKTIVEMNGVLDVGDGTITSIEEDKPEQSYSIRELLSEFHGKEVELVIKCDEKV